MPSTPLGFHNVRRTLKKGQQISFQPTRRGRSMCATIQSDVDLASICTFTATMLGSIFLAVGSMVIATATSVLEEFCKRLDTARYNEEVPSVTDKSLFFDQSSGIQALLFEIDHHCTLGEWIDINVTEPESILRVMVKLIRSVKMLVEDVKMVAGIMVMMTSKHFSATLAVIPIPASDTSIIASMDWASKEIAKYINLVVGNKQLQKSLGASTCAILQHLAAKINDADAFAALNEVWTAARIGRAKQHEIEFTVQQCAFCDKKVYSKYAAPCSTPRGSHVCCRECLNQKIQESDDLQPSKTGASFSINGVCFEDWPMAMRLVNKASAQKLEPGVA